MTQRLHIAAGTVLFAVGLLGCEDAGKKPVQARVPALEPAAATQAPAELALLPVVNPPHRQYVWLLPAVPDGKDYLISYMDCCGRSSCGQCYCSSNLNERPGYEMGVHNDVNWCMANGEASYHCTVSLIVGVVS